MKHLMKIYHVPINYFGEYMRSLINHMGYEIETLKTNDKRYISEVIEYFRIK